MTVPLECVDSTLAPAAILSVVRARHHVSPQATCELLQHNLDATYLVEGAGERLVVRLFNARWWARHELEAEVAVLRHLEARSIRVAAPLQGQDGAWVGTVRAPEGERSLLVYRFLEGESLNPTRDAAAFGELVGRLHRALDDFSLPFPRRELTWSGLVRDSLDAILAQLPAPHAQREYFEGLRARVLERGDALGLPSFRQGLCHGDLNFANAVRQPDGAIGLFDFEICGLGMLAYDLAVFRWTQQLVGAPEQTFRDFLDGYRQSGAIPERELEAMDLLVLLRQAFLIGHDARRTEMMSLGTRWRRVLRTPRLDALRRLDAAVFGLQLDSSE